jgi:lipopolysaccharide export system permease protein
MRAMKRVDRYLLREMVVPFLIGQGAVVMMLTGTVLYNNATVFLDYRVPAAGVARIALYFLPYLLHLTMPVAVAIAVSLAVSRLTRDSELTAVRSAGVSLRRTFRWVFIAGLALSVADLALGEWVVPWSTQRFEQTMTDLSRRARFLVPQEGQAAQTPDHRYTAFIGRMQLLPDRTVLQDVTLIIRGSAAGERTVVNAPTADYVNGKWILKDAHVHEFSDHGERIRYTRAAELRINFRLAESMFNLIALQLPLYSGDAAKVGALELSRKIGAQRRTGWVNPRDLLELQFKLSVPFSCLVFAIVCPPMALLFARAGSFMGVLLSIVLVFVYWNTLLAAKILGDSFPHILPPVVAGWGQNVLFAAIGLIALRRSE